ncbi:MAG: hypothetical protein IT279_06510 [Ignavibacteriaceae bacterium]|nr:hypothetical protein [Ignavibacteriaceae bacterium]
MSKTKKNTSVKTAKRIIQSPFSIYWSKKNYLFFGSAVLLIIIGFYVMSIGPWDNVTGLVYAPVILFIAYLILLPLSILYRDKNSAKADGSKVDTGKS